MRHTILLILIHHSHQVLKHCATISSDGLKDPKAHMSSGNPTSICYRGLHICCHKRSLGFDDSQYFHLNFILIGPFSHDTIDF